jgi:outer membrane protein assembly factor BamD
MIRKLLPILILALLFASCSKYQKLLKSTDNEAKYEMAIKLFEEKDYYRAIQLFDQLQPFYRGTDKAEKIAFYYAYAHYEERDYILASYYFKQFAANYPNSRNAEEAAFLSAYCNYLDSPPQSLDQTTTLDAIQGLQLFINRYPKSSRVARANELIDELRVKLESKAYDIADLYLKMEDYKAAIICFKNLIKEYPDTKYREVAMFNIAKASYYYAQKSYESKKQERFQETADALDNFIANYPDSKYRNEVLELKKITDKELQTQLTIK